MFNLTKIRQHVTRKAVLIAACVIALIVFLSTLYRHSYHLPEPLFESTSSFKPSSPNGPNTLVDRLLVLLPKDESTKYDYGFHEHWLEMAIGNRKDYADYHGEPRPRPSESCKPYMQRQDTASCGRISAPIRSSRSTRSGPKSVTPTTTTTTV
jgi:hypothetical protein